MSRRSIALLVLLAAPAVYAQTTTTTTAATSATDTTSATSAADTTSATSATSATSTDDLSNTSTVTDSTTTAASTASTTDSSTGTATTTGTSVSGVITDAPDIGVAIPTLVIPYTADAPFMQKSNLPEGTFFIAVGAVLAFLGACVLLWRGTVAWSVNRSVKRAARTGHRGGNEKSLNTWTPGHGYHRPSKAAMYNTYDDGSTMSLDLLNSSGKAVKDNHSHRPSSSAAPPAGLFFSPTAQAQNTTGYDTTPARERSSYMPAGYYASPAADRPGAGAPTFGGSLAPYARTSAISISPPRSPDLPPTSRGTAAAHYPSRDSTRPNDGLSRDGYGPSSRGGGGGGGTGARQSALAYAQPSTSSLLVGLGGDRTSGQLSRAPSAYLEDLFENHGHGPRERF